jgi:hypothetical protein
MTKSQHLDVPMSQRMTLNSMRRRYGQRIASWGDGFVDPVSASEHRSTDLLIHTPEEIAARLGNISIKTLSALIRSRALETTTLGYAPPSRKGGRPRRLWGMTDRQLELLLAVRNPRPRAQDENR